MSCLAVFLALDGRRRVTSEEFRPLLERQRASGPDAQLHHTDGPVALGIAVLMTTPEDHLDPPCAIDPSSGVVAVLDGYLSNREELAAALGIAGPELAACGDARLLGKAYARWYLEGCARAEGEFVAALWDPGRQQLLIVRDALGLRPIFYRTSARELVAATELHALVRAEASAINEGVVAETLAGRPSTLDETLFTDISRLPPAHFLVARADGQWRLQRYWSPDLEATLELPDDNAYAEAFSEQLGRAVRATLRSDRPVSMMLSGGMDSSVIMAEAVRQRGTVDGSMHALTVGFPGLDVDESSWAQLVASHTQTSWHPVQSLAGVYDYARDARETLQLPPYPPGANSLGGRLRAVELGTRVLLNGVGGDEWFYGSDWRYADFLSRGEGLSWWREIHADRVLSPVTALSLARNSLFPMVPRRWWRRVRGLVPRPPLGGLVRADFAERINLDERLLDRLPQPAGSYERRDIVRAALGPISTAAKEESASFSDRNGTADRHPFFDRTLVTFALSLPGSQRRVGGVTKRVVRRAYRTALPSSVVGRVEYFDYSFVVTGAVRELVKAGALARPHIVAHGWVAGDALQKLVSEATSRPVSDESDAAALRLWPALAVELWLTGVLA